MIDINAMRTRLNADVPSTEVALDTTIGLYKEAASYIAAMQEFQADCKGKLAEIMTETGETNVKTPSGSCQVTKPSVMVAYDRKALDALCASDERLRAILTPHRRETERAGTMMIR